MIIHTHPRCDACDREAERIKELETANPTMLTVQWHLKRIGELEVKLAEEAVQLDAANNSANKWYLEACKNITANAEQAERIKELEAYESAWKEWRSLQSGDATKLFDAAIRCKEVEAQLSAPAEQRGGARMTQIPLDDPVLDATDPPTRIFLAAEYWHKKAQERKARIAELEAALAGSDEPVAWKYVSKHDKTSFRITDVPPKYYSEENWTAHPFYLRPSQPPEGLKDAERLHFCFNGLMRNFVKPLMTFDEWLAAIDDAIAASKKGEG